MDVDEDPYTAALQMLAAGAVPVIVDVMGDIHVVSVIPTSRETLACIISDDEKTRGHFAVSVVKAVKERIEASV